jgi:hypothetical protein
VLHKAAGTIALLTIPLWAAFAVVKDESPRGVALPVLLGIFVISGSIWLLTADRSKQWLGERFRGPRIEIEEAMQRVSGKEGVSQEIRLAVYNGRDSGGKTAIAFDVVPTLELFDGEQRLAELTGRWAPDHAGEEPSTVTFRPTRERHELLVASKQEAAGSALLLGRNGPRPIADGTYRLCVSLRGHHLHKAAYFNFQLRNQGSGGFLELRRED